MDQVRPPAVAGSFYPFDAEALGALVDDCLLSSPLGPQGVDLPLPSPIAGMVPHAGLIYSGPCAAHFYALLKKSDVYRVLILGVNHRGRGHRAALSPWETWRTPLGDVPIDHAFSEFLRARVSFLEHDARAHSEEHSIEVQLPFLQRVLRNFSFLPISLSSLSIEECMNLGAALTELCANEPAGSSILILASSDLSHYLSPRQTDELDHMVLEKVLALNPVDLLNIVEEKDISMCGVIPAVVMLYAVVGLGIERARLLKHYHSGSVSPMENVVGYASVAMET